MHTILEAKDYGFRKVIRVVSNPEEPESIHRGPLPHLGYPPRNQTEGPRPWEWCANCTYNWDVQEFVWTGEELYTYSDAGVRRLKTNQELLDEIRSKLGQTNPAPSIISDLHLGV